MKQPIDVIAERIGAHEAAAVIDLLREAGWLILRHDAIRLAQAHEREWQENGKLAGAKVIAGGRAYDEFTIYNEAA